MIGGKAGEAYYAAGEALLVADEPHHAAVLFADASAAQQHIDPERTTLFDVYLIVICLEYSSFSS